MKEIKRIALIPAYKPDMKLLDTVLSLKDRGFDVVVTDDGSGKSYSLIFRTLEPIADIITHPENLGKGMAIKTGLAYIKEQYKPPYVVVTADADGQHRPNDIETVCSEAEKFPDTLILGSRKFEGYVPLKSKIGNAVTRTVFRLSTGKSIFDTQTGLRAFSSNMVDNMLKISGERYEYEMNVLMNFARNDMPVREIPIETVYINGNSSSHFDTFKDSARIYREIIKFSASSLISFLTDYLLYCIVCALSGSIITANISARICSSSLNYTLNRNIVFKDKSSPLESLPKYAVLALVILVCNTLILNMLVSFGINIYIAKLVTETLLFSLSWTAQHFFVFRKGKTYEKT